VTPKIMGIKMIDGVCNVYSDRLKCTLTSMINAYNYFGKKSKMRIYKKIFVQLLNCVEKMHKIGILHSDIKSDNIMLTYDNDIRLIDFGLSSFLNFCPSAHHRSTIMSTPYVDPFDGQQIAGIPICFDHSSYHSDIFSVGMVFYECITAERPFNCNYIVDKFYLYDAKTKTLSAIPERVLDKMNKFSEDFVDLMKIMLNSRAVNRWAPAELLQHKFFGGDRVYCDKYHDSVKPYTCGEKYGYSTYQKLIIDERLYEMYYFTPLKI